MMRLQMLGLCRFSYLGERGFQVQHQTIEERRAFLYDPARLARRWFWFERVLLPGLMAQTDPEFTLVLMTGPDLPQPYLDRLREVCAAMPQARLSLVPPMRFHLQACKQALAPHKDARADVIGHFRQDDDDGVAVDFIASARADFAMAEPLFRRHGAVSIDYMRGLVLKARDGRVSVEPRMIYNASVALVAYLPPGDDRSATQLPHWRMAHHMPGLSLGEKVMYCRTLHGDNDAGAVGPGYDFDPPPPDTAALLRERFRIDPASLQGAPA